MLVRPESKSLLEIAGKSRLEGYVLFFPSDRWWRILFRREYGHCIAVIRRDGLWVVVDPSMSMTELTILPVGINLREIMPNCTKIVRFVVWRDAKKMRTPWIFGAITCVEQIKALLGLRNPLLLTPYQLFKQLRK